MSSPRLFIDSPIVPGKSLPLSKDQTHYLKNVLRLKMDDILLIFNGENGEWRATFKMESKHSATLLPLHMRRPQEGQTPYRLIYFFAPLKQARLDYMIQKAVEMGVDHLVPVLTQHSCVKRLSLSRMRANAIEAAEQCNILKIPSFASEMPFSDFLSSWKSSDLLIFCDEQGPVRPSWKCFNSMKFPELKSHTSDPPNIGILVGPEGGFTLLEREEILALPKVISLSLGPRILRADTAAVAALALVQAWLQNEIEN